MALRMMPVTGLPVRSKSPPDAGPTTTVTLSSSAKRLFAATMSFSDTTSGVRAPAAGRYGANVAAVRTCVTSRIQIGPSAPTTTATPHVTTNDAIADQTMTRARS